MTPFTKLFSVTFLGLEAIPVEVEIDLTPSFSDKTTLVIVGLPDAAVKESKDRVLAAIRNTGIALGECHCTVNLAPGHLKKEGALYDLPIALGMIASKGVFNSTPLQDYLLIGECSLGGEIRPVRGALAATLLAKKLKKKGVLLPEANCKEVASVQGLSVYPLKHLKEAINFFQNHTSLSPLKPTSSQQTHPISSIDFSDVKGQSHVKRAMEIAAAGAHNVLLSGPPGSGKTMIAKAFVGIMPPLTLEESLEITNIYSIAGFLPKNTHLITQRPFRSPHHTVSYAGLIGGGSNPRPGEVSLAHHGILFLDELPEFSRRTLEVLRQPLEDGNVTISRAHGNITFPTECICIAAMNPCPCGYLGHPEKMCKDTDLQIQRYQGRISGPLLDRIDLLAEVPALRYSDLMQQKQEESSKDVLDRVIKCRSIQNHRFQRTKTNSRMIPGELKQFCKLDRESHASMQQAMDVMGISKRAHDRILKIARTIADLDNSTDVRHPHVLEAIQFRTHSLLN